MCLAIPGQVLEVKETDDPLFRTGRVSFSGIIKEVQLACTPDARPGDYVLVHVGFAIAQMDEAEARRTLEMIGAGDDGE
jgi:hydrogenase expression/formation protein HypC